MHAYAASADELYIHICVAIQIIAADQLVSARIFGRYIRGAPCQAAAVEQRQPHTSTSFLIDLSI